MGIYVNPGNANFEEAVSSEIYVDKSLLLAYTNKVIGTTQKAICVSRPRRFGKSITADMLTAYYGKGCDSQEIFANLKIAENMDFNKYLNQYNVIQVDMNNFRYRRDAVTGKSVTALQAVELFHQEIIRELKKEFPNVVEESDRDLPDVLAKIYEAVQAEFIIIIDEWDTIFREDKMDTEAQGRYIELLRGLFKNANSKKFLKLAYITGILPIKKYGTQSALNNFDEFSMVQADMLAEYTGFTEDEVRLLYEESGMDFEEAKRWYDGYEVIPGLHIYNPKSVVDSVRRKRIASYWTQTETYESLKNYISMNYDGLKDAIVKMISGSREKVNSRTFQNDMTSFSSRDDVLTLLIHLGYLAYDFEKKEVYVPNEEVREEFKNAMEGAGWDAVMKAISDSDKLMRATWNLEEEAVAKQIDEVHMANTSILSYNDENSLSCVISLAYYNAINEYTLIREFPAGKGYADIVFLPRRHSDKPAMVVELKYNKSSKEAITQIKEKKYSKALEEYQGNILLVGINYDEKTKTHQCLIEQIEK